MFFASGESPKLFIATKNLETLYFAASLLRVQVPGSDNRNACISAICSAVNVAYSVDSWCSLGGSCSIGSDCCCCDLGVNGIAGRLAGAGDEGGRTVKRIVELSVISKCRALGDSRFDRLSKKRGFVVNAWEFSEVLLLDDEEEVDAAGLQSGEQLLKSRLDMLERTQRCEVVRAACMPVVVMWFTDASAITSMESQKLKFEGDRKVRTGKTSQNQGN